MTRITLFIAIAGLYLTTMRACANGKAANNKNSVTEQREMVDGDGETNGVIHLDKEQFKKLVFDYENNKEWKYEGDKPAILDFYADWCGPCKKVAPILEELAQEYDGKIIIYKIDTEKEKELAGAFGIRSIPSLLFIPASGQPQMAQGALPKEQFVKVINEFLLKEEK